MIPWPTRTADDRCDQHRGTPGHDLLMFMAYMTYTPVKGCFFANFKLPLPFTRLLALLPSQGPTSLLNAPATQGSCVPLCVQCSQTLRWQLVVWNEQCRPPRSTAESPCPVTSGCLVRLPGLYQTSAVEVCFHVICVSTRLCSTGSAGLVGRCC